MPHSMLALLIEVNLNHPNWFTDLTTRSFKYFSEKALGRFPTADMLDQGYPKVPLAYDARWVGFGIGLTKNRSLVPDGKHLHPLLMNAKKRNRLHTHSTLFVSFISAEYLAFINDESASIASLPDIFEINPDVTYVPRPGQASIPTRQSPPRTRSKENGGAAGMVVMTSQSQTQC